MKAATHNIYRNIKIQTTRVNAVCESARGREWETVFLKETANAGTARRERERERERGDERDERERED